MHATRGARYRFGRHVLDLSTVELLEDGRPLELEPQTFAVLAHLVRNRGRAVTKEELLDAVWGDRFVSESALTTQIKHCRRLLGDDGRSQQVIRTLHRVGYRFVAAVEEAPEPTASERDRPASPPQGQHSPLVLKALIGRTDDLAAARQRLAKHRLVTLTGPGGIGKSELARHAAVGIGADTDTSTWMCDLSPITDPRVLPIAVLDAVGAGQHSDAAPVESLLRTLEARSGLLVLDGCEHLLDVTGPFVASLLRRCPGVRVLTTSRQPLGVGGESVLALDPLDDTAAAACFLARATDAGASVDPDDPALVELCRRLDGLPLAIELAAARARLLSPSEMLALLHDRFRLLRAADGAAHERRHRSLRQAIAWSWEDLAPPDQQLLCSLGAMAGTFGVEDAAGVALDATDPLDVVDGLERLLHRSLLQPVGSPAGPRRFRLLDSIRDFVREETGFDVALCRHLAHVTTLVERLDAEMQEGDVDAALGQMRAAWDDVRAALAHAVATGDLRSARRIIRAVGAYADLHQTYEVLDWCARAGLGDPSGDDDPEERAARAEALAVQARLLAHRGEQVRARDLAATALHLHESHHTVLSSVWCAYYEGDLDQVVSGAPRLRSLSRSARGLDAAYAEGFSAVVATVRQERALTSTPVTPATVAEGVLGTLDLMAAGFRLCAADPDQAAVLLEAVVERSLERDHRLLLGAAASTLTQITLPARPAREAMATLVRTLQRYRERSMWVLITADIAMAARLLADAGAGETAARLLGARRASGYGTGLSEALRTAVEDDLAAALGAERLGALAAEGAAWSPPQAATVAIDALRRHLDLTSGEP
jgi:predicted ATPase/DNA-binding winged helix-turn-helix (wHTH) protein